VAARSRQHGVLHSRRIGALSFLEERRVASQKDPVYGLGSLGGGTGSSSVPSLSGLSASFVLVRLRARNGQMAVIRFFIRAVVHRGRAISRGVPQRARNFDWLPLLDQRNRSGRLEESAGDRADGLIDIRRCGRQPERQQGVDRLLDLDRSPNTQRTHPNSHRYD
jgi:hypothetical protein